MTEQNAKAIYEQYNPKADIARCPNGRAVVRKLLDSYARAAVNLYGVISREELVAIFNSQNTVQTSAEEAYRLLLPLVLKEGRYCFYQEYIVHHAFFDDFDYVADLLEQQADKPRYLPEQDELLPYADEDQLEGEQLLKLKRFLFDTFGLNQTVADCYAELRDCIIDGDFSATEVMSILGCNRLEFRDEDQIQMLMDLIMQAANGTRIWENKGYAPSELHEILRQRNKNIVQFPILQRPKVGRNDPCPCGSGKKYKKCCALVDDAGTAQLSQEERQLFYETWYGLMGFVNERKQVIRAKIKPESPNAVSDVLVHKVREVLWREPALIDEYINETKLPQEQIDILRLWRTNHKQGMFLVLEYRPEYAVAIAPDEQGEDRLYGIRGMSSSVANVLRRELPVQVKTILLPFKGKIVYDSFLSSMQLSFGEGAKAMFSEMYEKAAKHGIITSLE